MKRLQKNRVCLLEYRTRDLGYGVEEDVTEAFWTGEVDTWGKLTIREVNGPTRYLFRDEIVRHT